ncbi:protein MMS22-like [Ischnura elegans]|uniref:protein MMS22-like n=1 Tax=Ischnura elegans TaxID=197161 RepID=UPI001ED8729E|nr:protein MMS22-like [Ischnura elegans]XP_046392252.1 protein MMS22-like [Ischnura elegans]
MSIEGFRWFECSGAAGNDETISARSFLGCWEKEFLLGTYKNEDAKYQSDILLFGRTFDKGSAIHQSRMLFQMARKEFKMLENSFPFAMEGGSSANSDMTEEECLQIRKNICELLSYIRMFLSCVPLESKILMDHLKSTLMPALSSFRKCLPKLISLPLIHHTHFFKKGSRGFYHFFHLNLDVRWYYISVLQVIKYYAESSSNDLESGMGFIIASNRVRETGQLECSVRSLLSELTFLAVARFEKANPDDLFTETPFACTCVRELWLLLQLLCDGQEENGTGKSFWEQVNSLLDRVQPITSPPGLGSDEQHSRGTKEKETFHCSDPVSFSLWMLLNLSQLYGYSDQGIYLGKKSKRVKNNFIYLEKILSSAVSLAAQNSSESQVERQMRLYILLASEICLGRWWEPMRGEPVMIFWEYFHRRLSASLLIPGTSPAALPIMSKSSVGMLERIRKSLSSESGSDSNFDSFFFFMKFLGIYLIRCKEEENTLEDDSGIFRQWQQIRGRIYSKLGPAKVKALSHIGLYRLINLFLMLSMTADVKEVGKKMLDMLGMLRPWDPSGRDFPKRELVWQAYICLICLHVERELDIAQIAGPLMEDVQAACNELGRLSKSNSSSSSLDSWKMESQNTEGIRKLLSLFTEGLNDIMELSSRLALSEFSLIGPWLPQWFSLCSLSAARRLMDTLLAVVDKLRKLRQSLTNQSDSLNDLWGDSDDLDVFYDGGENISLKEQWNKMDAALTEHVLPSVRNHCLGTNPPFQAADLAVSFTLSAFSGDGDSYTQLFLFFVGSDTVNHRISRRYLCQIMSHQRFMDAMSQKLNGFQDLIIQAWIRTSLLSVEESAFGELEELAGYVSKMSKISHLLSSQISSSNSRPVQIKSLEQFLKAIGEKYESLPSIMEKSTFRESCSVFFNKLDKIIGPAVRTPSSEDVIKSIYHCCGLLVLHCGNIIYIKGKPNCLLPSIISLLLLPPHIYNPEASIHKYLLSAVKRSINLYLRGLSKLSPNSNPYIKRCIQDVIKHYIPRLYEKNPGTTSMSHITFHPILESFENSDDQNDFLRNIIVEIIASVLQSTRGRQINILAVKCLGLLQQISEIARRKPKNRSKKLIIQVASAVLFPLMEFLINVSEDAPEWKLAFNTTNSLIMVLKEAGGSKESFHQSANDPLLSDNGYAESCAKVDSFGEDIRSSCGDHWAEVISAATQRLCKQNMAFSTSALFRIMHHFIRSNPCVVMLAHKHLMYEAKEVERVRGSGNDPLIRSCLQKLQTSLEAVKKSSILR